MSDDDFGRRLRDGIPEPRAGYWENIQASLGRIEAEQDFDDTEDVFDENLDTDPLLSRPTAMNNPQPPTSRPGQSRTLFAAAAALLLVLGIGAAALVYRGNDNDDVTEVDVASQPDGDTAPDTGGTTGDDGDTGGTTSDDTTDGNPVSPGTDDTTDPADPEPTAAAPDPDVEPVAGVVFRDAASPVGGTVKKATLSGPGTSMMVVCDQSGFEPFLFEDQGTWVGCQLSEGRTAGGESELTEPFFGEVASPVGGTVGQLIIPGPQTSVIVECAGGFEPFLFTDQGTWIGCQSDGSIDPEPEPTAAPPASDEGASGVVFGDADSPVGGTVKKAILSGPETSVLVACDQSGFEPFLFQDQGTWVGCQLTSGATAGAESDMADANFAEVPSPVGGTVGQITIPGPQTSVIVECVGAFEPFLFQDQGTWVGCQST